MLGFQKGQMRGQGHGTGWRLLPYHERGWNYDFRAAMPEMRTRSPEMHFRALFSGLCTMTHLRTASSACPRASDATARGTLWLPSDRSLLMKRLCLKDVPETLYCGGLNDFGTGDHVFRTGDKGIPLGSLLKVGW